MKIVFSFLLLLTWVYAFEKEVTIDKQKYGLVEESYEEYGEKGIILNFYHLPFSKGEKPSLLFLLSQQFGACSKRNYEESTYKIDGSKIFIYTKWSGYSIDGFRKMVYNFEQNSSKAKRLSCEFYIDSRGEYTKHEGVKYLTHAPKNSDEQKSLDNYIAFIEKIYKGKFLFGDAAKELSGEVASAFLKTLQKRWGN